MIRHWAIGVLMASSFVGGGALTVDTVPLTYHPPAQAAPLPNAGAVIITVGVHDARRGKDRGRVSVKKNGYGMEMADIRCQNDVPELVRYSVWSELSRRGFRYGSNGVTVVVDLRRFFNDFKTGFFSGDAIAETIIDVSVFAPGSSAQGVPIYTAHVEGEG